MNRTKNHIKTASSREESKQKDIKCGSNEREFSQTLGHGNSKNEIRPSNKEVD